MVNASAAIVRSDAIPKCLFISRKYSTAFLRVNSRVIYWFHMKNLAAAVVIFFIMLFVYTKFAGPIPFSLNSIVTTKTDTFTVTGTGKASAVPDVAIITVGVKAQGATVKQVQQDLNTNNNKVIDAVKKLGIDAADIQTSNYSLTPMYDYGNKTPQINGYQANTNIVIKVRNTDKANDVIDAATASGANQVGGLTFDVSDKTKIENEARAKAVAQAKEKAQTAAQTAGFTLGRVINYSEGLGETPQPMYNRALPVAGGGETASEPTQIEAGSNEITITVSLSYEIR